MKRGRAYLSSRLKDPALRVSLVFACFSILWILCSDQVLLFLIRDPDLLTTLQMLKGWLFVIVTACIIFALLKREVAKLRRTEDVLRATLNAAADGILVVSSEGRVIAHNNRLAAMWLIAEEELALMRYERQLTACFLSQLADPGSFQQSQRGTAGPPETAADELLLKDGRVFIRQGAPLIQNDHQTGWVWSYHDFTEHKRAGEERAKLEEQLQQSQKMEAIGTLAGGVAHDFNNILSAIFGYAELARADADNPDNVVSYLDEVLVGAERAKELVKQILAFSRGGAHELQPVKIQAVIREITRLLRSSLPSTIEITTAIDPDCPEVMADPTQLHQVVMNICTNAYHAMRQAGGVLSISLQTVWLDGVASPVGSALPAGSYAMLSIEDNGTGMVPEVLERIFEPYYSSKPKGEGTGLGLAVVHGIVSSYNGEITVASTPGIGARFTVYLPHTHQGALATQTAAGDRPLAPLPCGSERILLVDDDATIAAMNQRLLSRLGYQVTALTSSSETLAEFRSAPDRYDLVITDMTMPGMTGAELAARLLQIRPNIPVILCTGYSELIDAEKARAIGIRGYIMKPVISRDMAEVVRTVLDESRLMLQSG